METVESDGQPPPELTLALMCQKWNTLPDAGGMYEQDARMMKTMSGVLSVYNTMQRWRTLTGKQIHQLSDGERRILRTLKDMGLIFN